ncbi:MarC family protein [Falsiroseomonas oryzae]|uniref:MarC family protein n=1 Tax=Falsiroseomonas oryzae TaxID=2766473 RepID=UPI0022EA2432|nr:MarC family protein [Roseomonas sp. MO-31]
MIIDGFLVATLLSSWLFGYSALISIINPPAGALIFQSMTQWLTAQDRARLARAIALNSFVVLVVALFLGSHVLGFFGISLEALRIAGGLAVAVAGWRMLNEEPEAAQRRDARAPAALDTAPIERMAFFPLTLPLTTGPGSIAACIALSAERRASGVGDVLVNGLSSVLIAVSVAASVWIAYANAAALARRLGPQGTLVASKLAAFLLLCIGAQIMLTGATDALRAVGAARP